MIPAALLTLDAQAFAAGEDGADRAISAPMNVASGLRAPSPMLVARFPDAATANRRLAGMSAVGRWAARAREAGASLAVVAPGVVGGVGGGAQPWPATTLDDFARAGATPLLADVPPPALPLFDGRRLPDAAALKAALRGVPLARESTIDLADEPAALRDLLRATAKPGDGIVSRWLNRPVSQRITALLLRYLPDIRPSHATVVVGAVAVAMVACLLFGGAAGLIAGGVLFHVASVLDGVDGELARTTYRSSAAGRALDTRVDMLTNIGFFVGITVSLTRLYGGAQAMVGALVVVLALGGLAMVTWLARRAGSGGSLDVLKPYYRERFPSGWQYWLTEALVLSTSRDFFAFALGIVIVVGLGWTVSWLLLGFVLAWLTAVVCAIPGVLRQAELRPRAA